MAERTNFLDPLDDDGRWAVGAFQNAAQDTVVLLEDAANRIRFHLSCIDNDALDGTGDQPPRLLDDGLPDAAGIAEDILDALRRVFGLTQLDRIARTGRQAHEAFRG